MFLGKINKNINFSKTKGVKRLKSGQIKYRGVIFPGFNKPRKSTNPKKKKMVLVKKGDRIKLVHFGDSSMKDFRQHKSKKRQKSYLARSGGIRNKSGQLTKNDPFSANYWSRKKLW